MDCRLILDPPAAGSWNMGLDEALLESAGRAGQGTCLRFYQWDQPTLSLGYFQRCEDRRQHAASGACPVVRRSTGGGAIIHDLELTYSFTTAITSHISSTLAVYYDAFHMTLVDQLAAWRIDAGLYRQQSDPQQSRERSGQTPFLCFQRRVSEDVVLAGAKIAGSAQRRHRGALLQHGSILLQTSAASPELAGIAELSGTRIDARDLVDAWAPRIADRLGLRLLVDTVTERERELADQIRRDKFERTRWTCRR
jgi:lipoate-protein ligase A